MSRTGFVERARSVVGNPYKFGAEVPKTLTPEQAVASKTPFDCSELVEWAGAPFGQMPDGTWNQIRFGEEISVEDALALEGNLVFTMKADGNPVHVGITTGKQTDDGYWVVIEGYNAKYGVREWPQDPKRWQRARDPFAGANSLDGDGSVDAVGKRIPSGVPGAIPILLAIGIGIAILATMAAS